MALALGGVRALALCDLPPPVFATLVSVAFAAALREILHDEALGELSLDASGVWHAVERDGRVRASGHLTRAGYRGAALIVLTLEASDARGRYRHVPVHVDSVEAADFSFLHLSAMFAGGGR